MRADVKLGVLVSMVVVLIAGGYYLYRDKSEVPVVTGDLSATGTQPAAAEPKLPATQPKHTSPPAQTASRKRTAKKVQPRAKSSQTRGQQDPRRASRGAPQSHMKDAAQPTAKPPEDRTTQTRTGNEKPVRRPARVAAKPDRVEKSVPEKSAAGKERAGPRTIRPADARAVASRRNARTRPGADRKRLASGRSRDRSNSPPSLAAPVRPAGGKPAGDATQPTVRKAQAALEAPSTAIETHRVQPGDTFSSLAKDYYGSEKHTSFLIRSNPQISDPNRLSIGAVIKIPPAPSGAESSARAAGAGLRGTPGGLMPARRDAARITPGTRRTYEVRSGDSFYAIARDVLGDATRWKELFDLNRDLVNGDPTQLQVGQIVTLPEP